MKGGSGGIKPLVLLAHEGELDDVRALLCKSDIGLVEYRGAPFPGGDGDWKMVVATPQRMLDLGLEHASGSGCVKVAIGEQESKTLRKTMSRLGADFYVRRPVHPEALRLLLHHALYQGPEKRRSRRVQIGASTHYRTGLRKRPAVLVDLSIHGCRLVLFERGLEAGEPLTVHVPAGRASRKLVKVRGEVIRFSRAPSGEGRTAHVTFDPMSSKLAATVQQTVDEFTGGPESIDAAADPRAVDPLEPEAPEASKLLPEEPIEEAVEDLFAEPASEEEENLPFEEPKPAVRTIAVQNDVEDVPAPDQAADVEDEPANEADRRGEPRRIFTRRVVAQGADKTRVLMGRDLSPGGMRTDPDPDLHVGDEFSVALPLRAQHVPMVVKARVIRDDAERGLVLQFLDLSDRQAAFLEQHANLLPICDSPYAEEEAARVIASEIVEP